MTPDHIIPADLMQSSVAELAAEVVRLRAALDRTLEESAEATNGQARALVKIVDLKARAEAAEAKVARLVEAFEVASAALSWIGAAHAYERARAALREIGGQ